MALFRTKPLLQAMLLAAVLSLSLAVARAAEQEQPPQLTDDTADVINRTLRPANDAKDWDKALSVSAGVLAKVPPDSYDATIMYQIRSQVSYQKSDYDTALEALVHCVAINDQKHYFDAKTAQELLYQVSQFSYQIGATSKDVKVQAAYFLKADNALEKWLINAVPKNFNSLHRNATTQTGITLDDEGAAMPAGTGRLGGETLYANAARHHVLGHAPADATVNGDIGVLVHATEVIAAMAHDVDVNRNIHARSDAVHAIRIEDFQPGNAFAWQLLMQVLVQLAHTDLVQV